MIAVEIVRAPPLGPIVKAVVGMVVEVEKMGVIAMEVKSWVSGCVDRRAGLCVA